MAKETVLLTKEQFTSLLDALDYKVNEKGVIIDLNNKEVICPFTAEPVKLDMLSIMPGSIVLMNTTPVTLSEYFYNYPEDDR